MGTLMEEIKGALAVNIRPKVSGEGTFSHPPQEDMARQIVALTNRVRELEAENYAYMQDISSLKKELAEWEEIGSKPIPIEEPSIPPVESGQIRVPYDGQYVVLAGGDV